MTTPTLDLRLLIISSILLTPVCFAQDTVDEEIANIDARERIIVNVEHLDVDSIASAVKQLSNGDLRLFSDPATNRLVVDGPKENMPAVIGLIRELDRAVPQVKVKLTEAVIDLQTETKLDSGPNEDVIEELKGLVKSEKAQVVNRLSIEAANNTAAQTQLGAQKPSVAGANRGQKSYQYHDVGTMFQCTPRIAADAVLLSYSYERSDIANSEDEESPKTLTKLQSNSIIRIPVGQSVVIGGLRPGNDGETVMWKIILSAEVITDAAPTQ